MPPAIVAALPALLTTVGTAAGTTAGSTALTAAGLSAANAGALASGLSAAGGLAGVGEGLAGLTGKGTPSLTLPSTSGAIAAGSPVPTGGAAIPGNVPGAGLVPQGGVTLPQPTAGPQTGRAGVQAGLQGYASDPYGGGFD